MSRRESRFPRPWRFRQGSRMSTQEGFGRLLNDLARDPGEFADRIVTASPDVTVSTNLGAVGQSPRRVRPPPPRRRLS